MSCFQGGGVIDPIPGHGDHLPIGLQRLDDAQLLFGDRPGKYAYSCYPPLQFNIIHLVQLRAYYDLVGRFQANLAGDVLGSTRIIAGDHNDSYSGGIAFLNRFCYPWPDRVGKA